MIIVCKGHNKTIFSGVGASLVYGPSIILLGYYFENGRKALAYGIAFSGMGGASLVYGPSIILLGYYFENGRKALAYGIAFSGMGFGIFVIPLAYQYLRHNFGFEGTVV